MLPLLRTRQFGFLSHRMVFLLAYTPRREYSIPFTCTSKVLSRGNLRFADVDICVLRVG
jgi:hypothetical protein